MKNSILKVHIRVLSAVLALIMIFGVLPVQAAVSGAAEEDSILYNGSFDLRYTNNQTPPGWSLNKNSTGHTAVVQKNVFHGSSGNALKIQATGVSYIYSTDFSVESGQNYILSYWIRVDEANGLEYAPFLNDSNYAGGWWKDYAAAPVCQVTDGWVKISNVIAIPQSVGQNPANVSSKIQLGFKVYAGSGTIYLDDVSFVKVDVNKNDPNLSFEKANSSTGKPLNWSSAANGMELSSDRSVYHDGGNSMAIVQDSLAEKSYVTSDVRIPVEGGNVYEFSFWVKSQNADPTVTVRMDLLRYDAQGNAVLQENGDPAFLQGSVTALNGSSQAEGWKNVVTRSAVEQTDGYVGIRFVITRGSAELWLDDISLRVVENGIDCVVYYDDFHAVDESGNISTWKSSGGEFTPENGGKLTVSDKESYIYTELTCLMTDYTYCLKGDYTANMGGTVQVRFYDYQKNEYTQQRKTVALQADGTSFAVNFTAPSHTYAAIYIGSDQAGTITVSDVTVYMTAQPSKPNRNYLDADWSKKADRENVVSSVEIYNGIPTLMIDGQPTAAYFYQRPDLDAYLQTDAESRIANSGLELYVTYGGNLYKGGCDPIWLEDGSIDYDAFDAVIYDTLAANDDALVMVNIGMFAPKWWLEQNPDHRAQAHNGSSYIALDDVSLASEKFRQEAGEVLRQLIAHMKEQNYYNRVFGLKISGGQSYEWMHLGTGSDQGPDYSAVSQEGFRTYLKNKYGTDAALQAAWGNGQVTLETAAAPGWEERCASSNVYVGDVDTGSLSRNIVDWNLWLGEASADSFLYYCQIAKEETDNQIIVGGYNGYLWTSNTHDSQGKAHTAMDRVLDSLYVDWIASPIAYSERLMGQSSAHMVLLDTVQAHGKLYVAEQDNRTCLSDSYAGVSWDADWDYKIGQTRTMADTIYQQKRDFANAFVNGAGLWQFDMYGGWLDDDQLYDYFRDAKAEFDLSVHVNRNTTNEVAVFVGDETYAYLTAENSNMSFTLLEPMLLQQRKHLAAMGAGYDTYAMSSLLDGKVPHHKLNIILSPFEITPQMQEAIDTHLKTNNQVVVWVYLPGISTGTELSLSNVERTTGFSIGAVEKKSTLQVQLADSGHSITDGIAGLIYGNSVANSVSPMPYLKDTAGATVLGYHVDGGKPGLAVKDMGNWTSVYSAAPCLDAALLRNLMDLAGCHTYSENNADVIYSSGSYVALHSAAAGEKTIRLPGNFAVYDVFEKTFVSMNTDRIVYHHTANDTHIFRLMKPNTYAVTASIQTGKGTISAPGLTQMQPGSEYRLTVTPDDGYEIAEVTVNGKITDLENGMLCIDQVQENTAIEVKFALKKLLENYDFELGTFGGSVAGSGAASVVSDAQVHSGMYSLRLNHDGTARDLMQILIRMNPAEVDRTLTVTMWAKTPAGAAARGLHRSAGFFTEEWGRTRDIVYDAIYPVRDQWNVYTQTLTLPAGTEIFQYQLYTDTVNADVYIDDISITCDGQEMMVNGGLERGNLTGSFEDWENTPQLLQATTVHSGGYAALLKWGGMVSATVTGLELEKMQKANLQFWVYSTGTSGTKKLHYTVSAYADGVAVSERTGDITVSANSQWNLKELDLQLPENSDSIVLQLSAPNSTGIYIDDLQCQILPPKQIALGYQQIYSDGTWRLTAENISQLTASYYKIPVIIDGAEGYAVAHKTGDLLCIYPDFFGVYGMKVPKISFVIPEGGVIKAVSPDLQWGEMAEKEPFVVKEKVEVYPAEAYVKYWNLSLGGDLTVNFYLDIAENIAQDVQVQISVAEEMHTFSVLDDSLDEDLQLYQFSVPIAAAQMCDEICVQTVVGEKVIASQSYTVEQYAQFVLSESSMQAYHALVTEMLRYGSAAQQYFDYRTEQLADQNISGGAFAEIPQNTQPATVEGSLKGLQYYGTTLLYRDRVSLRLYFTVREDIASFVFTVDGVAYEAVQKDELYYVELPGINPQDWDKPIQMTVRDEDGNTLVISYSPMKYMVRMYEKGSDSMKLLVTAMYNYHLAAKLVCAQ